VCRDVSVGQGDETVVSVEIMEPGVGTARISNGWWVWDGKIAVPSCEIDQAGTAEAMFVDGGDGGGGPGVFQKGAVSLAGKGLLRACGV
jgi:hypothetical protein